MGQVCIPPTNQPPVANAGIAQTVASGAGVVLNGAGSTDPDGDSLTYQWTVLSGTVTLGGATTATPYFTAPTTTTTTVLVFQLTVNDGRGGSNSATTTVTVTGSGGGGGGAMTPILYVADNGGNRVLAWQVANANDINGNIAPDANLSGALTLLLGPLDVLLDSADSLIVSNFGSSITSYATGTTLASINGSVAPDRNVSGAATTLASPHGLALNAGTDVLFLSDSAANRINSYGSASTAALNGNIAPTRTIAGVNVSSPQGICLGAGDTLYVANNVGSSVAVFAGASTLNGAIAANRVITSAVFANLMDVFVDGSDNLFVVCSAPTNAVQVISNASTRNGVVPPSVTLTVAGATALHSIVVDSSGRGYISDMAGSVYSYDNIATRNGVVAPDTTLTGAGTQLVSPRGMYMAE